MAHSSERPYLPFGDAPSSSSQDLSPALWQYAQKLYRRAWTEYREAGCPYGPADKAMLVWYSLQDDRAAPSPITSRN